MIVQRKTTRANENWNYRYVLAYFSFPRILSKTHCAISKGELEGFLFEYRKTKIKVIILTNHNRRNKQIHETFVKLRKTRARLVQGLREFC